MHQNKQNIANIYESVNPSSKALYCSCTAENHPGHLPFLQSLPYCPEHLNHASPRKLQHRRSQNTDSWPQSPPCSEQTELQLHSKEERHFGSPTRQRNSRCLPALHNGEDKRGCAGRDLGWYLPKGAGPMLCPQCCECPLKAALEHGLHAALGESSAELHEQGGNQTPAPFPVEKWPLHLLRASVVCGSCSNHRLALHTPGRSRHKVGGHRHPGMDGLLGRARGSQEE